MEKEQIDYAAETEFKKHFEAGMKNKDFKSFKGRFPTLLKCIVAALVAKAEEVHLKTRLEFYEKLSKKLAFILAGNMTLSEYEKEVNAKIEMYKMTLTSLDYKPEPEISGGKDIDQIVAIKNQQIDTLYIALRELSETCEFRYKEDSNADQKQQAIKERAKTVLLNFENQVLGGKKPEIQLTPEKWITSDRPFKDYPLGTKAQALMGGYWEKVANGWKWCTGATFPQPGGDWTGKVALPCE